ncbi:MAG: glycosyltransferase [Candidatus Bathyarchaeota archaeon]|nr:glycosyltransferase [Candidatus Bathyarchaeota archaeon]
MSTQKTITDCPKKICWLSFLVLDEVLYKTSQIEVLRGLAERGHKTTLFGVYSKEKFEPPTNKVRVVALPMRFISPITLLLYTLLLTLYLPFYLTFSKTDFVIVEPQDPVYISLIPIQLFPKSRRPKIIFDIRTTPVDGPGITRSLFGVGVAMAKKLGDGMTIITPMMRAEICDRFQINPETVGVWPSGVSTTLFNPENFDRELLRKASGLTHKFVVFYHGSMGGGAYKYAKGRGIVDSIKSMKLLENKYPDVVLYLLGSSRSFGVLKKAIAEYGVGDRVILHDKVTYEEVPKYVTMCDVGLIPIPDLAIWRNQCPLKLVECAAMGKAIIATDIPAHRYILGNYKSAVFIPNSSAEEIAKAISQIHDDYAVFVASRKDEMALIEEKFSWRQVAADFERYLLSL